jgi:hypothetical protein
MLKGVKAGHGVAIITKGEIFRHEVHTLKVDIPCGPFQFPDVENLDFSECGHVSYESIKTRTDVDMLGRFVQENLMRHQQVLVEIMTRYLPAFLVALFHAGIKLCHREFADRRSGLPDKVAIVSQERGHASQYRKKGNALDEDSDLHVAFPQTVTILASRRYF